MPAQANLLKSRRFALPLLALLALLAGSLQLGSPARHSGPNMPVASVAHPDFGNLPLSFEPNAGQAGPSARFVAHSGGANIYFNESGLVLSRGPGNGERGTAGRQTQSPHPQAGSRDPRSPDAPRSLFTSSSLELALRPASSAAHPYRAR
jgi:hypothetical protein